jgi:hypothetical protein
MNNLNEGDSRLKELILEGQKLAHEVIGFMEEKCHCPSDEEKEIVMGTLLSVLAAATYGTTFRDRGEKAADRWLEFLLTGMSEGIQALGLRRCFAFARDPIVLDPRSSPSGPSSPKS